MRFPTLSRRLLLPGVVAAVVALLLGAGAAAAFEADTVGSYWGGLWWAVSLMTTVGFVGRPPSGTVGQIERDLDTQILTTLTSILERLEALESRRPPTLKPERRSSVRRPPRPRAVRR